MLILFVQIIIENYIKNIYLDINMFIDEKNELRFF